MTLESQVFGKSTAHDDGERPEPLPTSPNVDSTGSGDVQERLDRHERQLEELRKEIRTALERAEAAERRAEAAERELEALKRNEAYLTVDAAEFAEKAEGAFGGKRFIPRLSHVIGISIKKMKAHLETGRVPATFVEVLDELSEHDREPTSKEEWAAEEAARLRELFEKKVPDHEIAQKLTVEFGKKRLETAVLKRRREIGLSLRERAVKR